MDDNAPGKLGQGSQGEVYVKWEKPSEIIGQNT